MGRSNPFGDLDQMSLVWRYGGRNHVCNIWWLSVKGCGCGERGKFALSHWLDASPLQHWSHYRVTVWLHQCLPLPRKRSPDGASPDWGCAYLIAAYLLLIHLPRKDERLCRPGWLTYSGRFTHISGHPSAACRAQNRESSPVKDRRSTKLPTVPSRCYNREWLHS